MKFPQNKWKNEVRWIKIFKNFENIETMISTMKEAKENETYLISNYIIIILLEI